MNSTYTTPVLSATTTYHVSITNGTCESIRTPVTASISNLLSPVITFSGNTALCIGQTLTLSAPVGFASYNWSTGASAQQIDVGTAGNYTVTITDALGCTSLVSNPISITETGLPCANEPPVISPAPLSIQIEGVLTVNLLSIISVLAESART